MKKILFAVALLLGMSALFVSCNKDNGGSEGDYAKLIVGEWKMEVEDSDGYETHFEFFSDGTYTSYLIKDGRKNEYDIRMGYTIKGKSFTNGLLTITIEKITKTEMIWRYPTGQTARFTRVK